MKNEIDDIVPKYTFRNFLSFAWSRIIMKCWYFAQGGIFAYFTSFDHNYNGATYLLPWYNENASWCFPLFSSCPFIPAIQQYSLINAFCMLQNSPGVATSRIKESTDIYFRRYFKHIRLSRHNYIAKYRHLFDVNSQKVSCQKHSWRRRNAKERVIERK